MLLKSRWHYVNHSIAAVENELEIVAPQRELLQVIREELGEDGVLVSDLTQLYFAAQDVFPVHRPRTYIQPSYQGTLGHAAATCLGAQVAVGDRPVIGLAGDGGFMFTVQELATAVQYNIPVTFLVMNDGAFGNVKRILQEDYDNRVICADLQNPRNRSPSRDRRWLNIVLPSFHHPGHCIFGRRYEDEPVLVSEVITRLD